MSIKTFWNALKTKLFNLIIDPFFPPCPSGLPHKKKGEEFTNKYGNKYCHHDQCVNAYIDEMIANDRKDEVTIGVGDGSGQLFVHGDYESIKCLQLKLFELERLRRNNNNQLQANLLELKNGNTMDLQTVSDLMLEAHTHLVEQVEALGIIEARIPSFISWYENVRDNRVSAKQDHATYNLCKTIVGLEQQILEARSEIAKGTTQ